MSVDIQKRWWWRFSLMAVFLSFVCDYIFTRWWFSLQYAIWLHQGWWCFLTVFKITNIHGGILIDDGTLYWVVGLGLNEFTRGVSLLTMGGWFRIDGIYRGVSLLTMGGWFRIDGKLLKRSWLTCLDRSLDFLSTLDGFETLLFHTLVRMALKTSR